MRDNPFDELLEEFQGARDKMGERLGFLYALTPEDREAEAIGQPWELGFLPLYEDDLGKSQGCCIRFHSSRTSDEGVEEHCPELCRCFRGIAAKAGAALPTNVKVAIPVAPHSSFMWWVAYMVWREPTKAHVLMALDDEDWGEQAIVRPGGDARRLGPCAFLTAIAAIERGGLLEDTTGKIAAERLRASIAGAGNAIAELDIPPPNETDAGQSDNDGVAVDVEEPPEERGDATERHSITVDYADHTVLADGTPVRFDGKVAWLVFEKLWKNKPRAVQTGKPDTVKAVRAKFKKAKLRWVTDSIKTRRGLGHCLELPSNCETKENPSTPPQLIPA